MKSRLFLILSFLSLLFNGCASSLVCSDNSIKALREIRTASPKASPFCTKDLEAMVGRLRAIDNPGQYEPCLSLRDPLERALAAGLVALGGGTTDVEAILGGLRLDPPLCIRSFLEQTGRQGIVQFFAAQGVELVPVPPDLVIASINPAFRSLRIEKVLTFNGLALVRIEGETMAYTALLEDRSSGWRKIAVFDFVSRARD